MKLDDRLADTDPFDLRRFISAQAKVYATVLNELKSGHKRSHWMWYIFPQVDGLGHSATAKYYAIKSAEEARHYLAHPVLGARLRECAQLTLVIDGRSARDIFAYPDNLKFKSCMTLFAYVARDPGSVFIQALDQYFQGQQDTKTLDILKRT